MVCDSREYIIDIRGKSRKHDLCLGISETAVELDHLHACRSLHESAVKYARERATLCDHSCRCRLHDLLHCIFHILVSDDRNRRICAHTACIRALVALIGALVVL